MIVWLSGLSHDTAAQVMRVGGAACPGGAVHYFDGSSTPAKCDAPAGAMGRQTRKLIAKVSCRVGGAGRDGDSIQPFLRAFSTSSSPTVDLN